MVIHKTHLKAIALIALLFATQFSNAQPRYKSSDYRFQHYDMQDGLASESAVAIAQDSLGFIWILHANGLSRFDGHNFKIYYHDPRNETSVGPPLDGFVELDHANNLWVVSNQGYQPEHQLILSRYDRRSDSFVKYTPDMHGSLGASLCIDKDNTIWIGTWGRGLYAFNIATGKTESYLNMDRDTIVNLERHTPMEQRNAIFSISDRDSVLLLGTWRGLWQFDKTTRKFSHPSCHPSDSALLYNSAVPELLESTAYPAELSFVIDDVGLFTVDKKFATPSKQLLAGTNTPKLRNLTRDKFGVFWFVKRSGELCRFDPKDSSIVNFKRNPSDSYAIRSNGLNSVLVDRDQNVWLATIDQGISKLPRRDLRFYNYDWESDLIGRTIFNANKTDYVMVGRRDNPVPGHLMVAAVSRGGLHNLNFREVTLNAEIRSPISQIAATHDRLWLGTDSDGVIGFAIDRSTGLLKPEPIHWFRHDPANANTISAGIQSSGDVKISGIWEDANKTLWVGSASMGGGLNRINLGVRYGEPGSVTRFNHIPDDSTSLSNSVVWWEMFPDEEDSFWVITASGLDHFSNGAFEHYFQGDYVMTIKRDAGGTLLVGTTVGLYKGTKGERYSFEKDSSRILSSGAFAFEEDSLGRLWIATQENIKCYDRQRNTVVQFGESEGLDFSMDYVEQTVEGIFVAADFQGISLFDPYAFQIDETACQPVFTRLLVNNRPPVISRSGDINDQFQINEDISVLNELVLDYTHNNFTLEFSALQMTSPDKNLYKHKLEGFDNGWIETDGKQRSATYTNLDAGTYTFKVKASNRHGIWSDKETNLKIVVLPPPWRTTWAYSGYAFVIVGLLFAARKNIVQRERLKSNLKLAKVEREKEHFELEKVKEVDKLKSTFFTNISHEFRTPLTLIRGPIADMLEEYAFNAKTLERLKLVQRNSDTLLKLINQLLDLAKLESGSLTVEQTNVDLPTFILQNTHAFSPLALQKNIALTSDVTHARYIVSADKEKLETLLNNILNNAIKFTSPGGSVGVRALLEEGKHLIITVADNGIGIPSDQLERIFERFHQVSQIHKEVGTGIGLSLVKELTTLLGGTVSVSSEPGKGSEFTLRIPVELVSTSSAKTELIFESTHIAGNGSTVKLNGAPHPEQAKPQVLIVEDNTDLRNFIISSLGNEYQFLEASDGKQGLQVAFDSVPDLIISDVMMPEMDGIMMTGTLKQDTRTSHIPLILLSAKVSDEGRLSGLGKGADDYLTKPFNKQELLLRVRNSIAAQGRLREKVRLELMKEMPKVEVHSADEEFLLKVKTIILARLNDEQLSVESLAEEVALSRSQLLRKVTALTGTSVNELIRTFRLQRAAQLLGRHWGSVSQVAYEVGFSNLSYFSKVFKEQYGVLPSEYVVSSK